jgi:hypothetical protein
LRTRLDYPTGECDLFEGYAEWRRGADQFELLVIHVKQSVRARREIAAATTRTPLGHNAKFATAASAVTRATCDGTNPTVSGAAQLAILWAGNGRP